MESFEEIPFSSICLTYLGYYLLLLVGYINKIFRTPKIAIEKYRDGYVSLYNNFERLYLCYIVRRFKEYWQVPITSVPGPTVTVKERFSRNYGWTLEFTGIEKECINLGSYNYLGFAQNVGQCAEDAENSIKEFGVSTCSSSKNFGTSPLHNELEKLTAQFLGVEDSIVFGMGFATNSMNLPGLLGSGCLVISDVKNHASIILGVRLSDATIQIYNHNDVRHLEDLLRNAIINGQPETGEPWRKIVIITEGIFSMEGSIVKLPEIVALKKKYKAYIYLDEAHSIGSIGRHGRGVIDYYGINPEDIDVLMGTFSKSFGSAGGYIAGSKRLINFFRVNSHAQTYASSMPPPVAQQILTSMKIIMGLDGTTEGKRKIETLARNTKYFRQRLEQIGVIIYGHEDSPVVPMIVSEFSKIAATLKELFKLSILVAPAIFPATPILSGRIRFCLSAAHTKEQLDYVLDVIDEMSESMALKLSRKPRNPNLIEY